MYKVILRHEQNEPIQLLNDFVPDSWIHMEEPSLKEIDTLVDQFELDPWIVADALDLFELPRIEKDEDKLYYFARYPIYTPELDQIGTAPLLIVIGKNFFITICPKKFANVSLFEKGKIDFQTSQKANLLGEILSTIDDEYESLIKKLSKQIKQQASNFEKITNKKITQFVNFENVLDDLLFSLYPTSITLGRLLKGRFMKLGEEEEELIEDLIQNNEQLTKMCESNSKRVINTREAYANILSNNLNKIMKLLTAVTVILTIPTMVSGIFGMNVAIPLSDHPLGFWIIIVSTAFSAIGLFFFFLRQDWI
ncbi:magnesium transporter CorA family protein [Patescibacteria group bacterium]|nr:magnesium transporter CorA family protein [Patescibacteria group bacterium]